MIPDSSRGIADGGGLRVLAGAEAGLQSVQAERALLGCVLADGTADAVQRCVNAGVGEKAFGDERRSVWRAMVALAAKAVPVDVVTVTQEMADAGELEDAGGPAGISRLSSEVGSTAQFRYFLEKVMGFWRARQVRWLALQMAEQAVSKAGDWELAWREIGPAIETLRGLEGGQRGTGYADLASASRAQLVRMAEGSVDKSRWLYAGIGTVDRHLGAVDFANEDMLILIAAGPSVGKSALARQYVSEAVKRGLKCGVFLLETSSGMYVRQMASQRSRVNLRTLEGAPIDVVRGLAEAHEDVVRALGRNLWVWDDVYRMDRIEANVRELVRAAGGLDMVVVDYTQLVEPDKRCRSREEEVAHVARRLKLLAKDVRCPIFALCQINREAQRENRRPRKSDLRESGALEQAADRVLALYMPEKDICGAEQGDNQARVMMEFCQLKMRNGPLGSALVWFDRPYTVFSEVKDASANWHPAPAGGDEAPKPGMRRR